MASPLPPRVSGPLSVLSREVVVEAIDPAADVVTVLADGGDVGSGPAAPFGGQLGLSSGGSTFARVKLSASLRQGQRVTAVQTVGGAPSKPSRVPVVVIGVPSQLGVPDVCTFPVAGVEALLVRRLFPGAELTVSVVRGGVSSTKTIPVDDFAEIAPTPSPLRTGDSLQVIQRIGNVANGWSAPQSIEPWGGRGHDKDYLPTPVFELAPQACDRGIRLGNLVPGATAVVKINGGELRRRSVVNRVVVPVASYVSVLMADQALAEGDRLVIWQEFPSTGQRTDPGKSLVHVVGPAVPPARPVLWSGICPQSTEIVVTGYRPGATIRIYQAPPGSAAFALRDDLTHRAPLLEPDVVPVTVGFPSGGQVVATQDPCRDLESLRSLPITVTSVDETAFGRPTISDPIVECASGVIAGNLALGASASIWSDTLGGSITPSRTVMNWLPNWFDALILRGDALHVVQSGCIAAGARTSDSVAVQPANGLPPVFDYVFVGDRSVWVWCSAKDRDGNDVPACGARVDVFLTRGQTRHWVGFKQSSGDGWAQVALIGWVVQDGDELTATAQLCGDPIHGEEVVKALPPRPPRPPGIINPPSGSTTFEDHPLFKWEDPDAGTAYEALSFTVGIADDAHPGVWILPWAHTEQTSLRWSGAPAALAVGHAYSWFVVSEGRRGQSAGTQATVTRRAPATPPPPPPPPPPSQGGFSKLVVWNCNSSWDTDANGGTVTAYMRDRASGADLHAVGTLDVGYAEGGGHLCGYGYSTGEEYPLEDGHVYDFVFVDAALPGCDGDPHTIGCARLKLDGIVGRRNGGILYQTIG